MVWLATLLFIKVGEPDDGVPVRVVPAPLRALTALGAVSLAAVLVTGTLVTAAGPHAGDKSVERPVARLAEWLDAYKVRTLDGKTITLGHRTRRIWRR